MRPAPLPQRPLRKKPRSSGTPSWWPGAGGAAAHLSRRLLQEGQHHEQQECAERDDREFRPPFIGGLSLLAPGDLTSLLRGLLDLLVELLRLEIECRGEIAEEEGVGTLQIARLEATDGRLRSLRGRGELP